ncbi:Na+/H+ antiporter subunit A [Herbiconiux liukaitaii]|uniref:Na+/H+ antiporter subunit A n=1 Tax=Herbiconiux liukaitaii TaxID=3342799 RepID=UPI0035B84B4A
MILVLLLFAGLAALTPVLTRLLGTKVFYLVAILPAAAFVYTLSQTGTVLEGGQAVQSVPWIPQLGIAFSFRVDLLAWLLALVVTGVGALVLIYCARYFSEREPQLGRFAALLLAFAGTMYGLVTADDIYIMFMFWEITSVLSYLLIGHYTERKESRGAALQALLVTTFGGLAMLVGIILLSTEAGTSSIEALVANPPEGSGLVTTAIMLILVGALSKSALLPFHFWLPAAMAAPTPVSAYLHAAAMVKAGIYLVARFAPGFADTPGWVPVLVAFGVWTMLVGAWRSLRQYDLKLLLAYGTVSQLGFLTVVVGFGTRDSALAGAALLLAHALFKATLFLVVGIIDHDEGTRDLREISGLGRRRPVLAAVALIAVASMAGIPPLLGFVAKEAVLTAFLHAGEEGDLWGWVALVGVSIGSLLTTAYSARFFWGAFFTKKGESGETADAAAAKRDRAHREAGHEPHPPAKAILLAPIVLTLATIAGGFFAGPISTALEVYADSIPHTTDFAFVGGSGEVPSTYHLALWHGFEPALGISALVVAGGLGLFAIRRPFARLQRKMPHLIDASRTYVTIVRGVDQTAARVTLFAQKGGLPQYLGTILVVFVLCLGATTAFNRTWPSEIVLFDYPAQVFVALAMGVAAIMAARATHRLAAVLLVGVTGFGMVALFAFHGAPDLALTQALVETVTIVVFVLVLRRLPVKIAQHNRPMRRRRRALIGTLVGVTMGVVGMVALGARQVGDLSEELARLSVEEGHGQNIVNVMLVDIRAWDTMNELSVLIVVATGVASLIFVTGRNFTIPRLRESRGRRQGAQRIQLVDDPHTSDEMPEDRQHSWLLGGKTLSPANRSLILEVLVRLVFHPAIVVSIFLLFAGHNAPGGGFAAGLVAGLALIARYLAGGRYELGETLPIGPGVLLGAGMLLATGTAVGSLFLGAEVLTSAYFSTELPLVGYVSFGTSTIFDVGVYLVVIGVVLDILRALGGEVDRQLAEDDVDAKPDDHSVVAEEADTRGRVAGSDTSGRSTPSRADAAPSRSDAAQSAGGDAR